MKNKLKHILFSVVFLILFSIIFFTELFNFINFMEVKDLFNICLSFLAILVSSVGMYVSIIFGIVKLFMKENKNSGGIKNGKNKKEKN